MIIIPLRHFPYDKQSGQLTKEGREQAEKLGARLKKILYGIRMRIIHAPAIRCAETAQIIGKQLPATVTLENCLDWSPQIGDGNNAAVQELLAIYENSETQVLIVVSHDAMVNRIAEWSVSARMCIKPPRIDLQPGQCCVIRSKGEFFMLP